MDLTPYPLVSWQVLREPLDEVEAPQPPVRVSLVLQLLELPRVRLLEMAARLAPTSGSTTTSLHVS